MRDMLVQIIREHRFGITLRKASMRIVKSDTCRLSFQSLRARRRAIVFAVADPDSKTKGRNLRLDDSNKAGAREHGAILMPLPSLSRVHTTLAESNSKAPEKTKIGRSWSGLMVSGGDPAARVARKERLEQARMSREEFNQLFSTATIDLRPMASPAMESARIARVAGLDGQLDATSPIMRLSGQDVLRSAVQSTQAVPVSGEESSSQVASGNPISMDSEPNNHNHNGPASEDPCIEERCVSDTILAAQQGYIGRSESDNILAAADALIAAAEESSSPATVAEEEAFFSSAVKYGLQDVMGSIDADDDADDGGGAGDDGILADAEGDGVERRPRGLSMADILGSDFVEDLEDPVE